MAVQVKTEELEGLKSYFVWLIEKIDPVNLSQEISNEIDVDSVDSTENYITADYITADYITADISRELCRLMFETDFYWKKCSDDKFGFEIREDEIRAKDALEVRRKYADQIGKEAGKSDRDIDRIWKSIHGQASVLEVIFSLCCHLDAMVNEDSETGSMVGLFFRILIHNLRLDEFDDEDFDHREEEIRSTWNSRIKKFLNRDYFESGCCGGLFPLSEWTDNGRFKDQRKVGLWYQMNTWLNEHLDENGEFVVEKMEKNEPKSL